MNQSLLEATGLTTVILAHGPVGAVIVFGLGVAALALLPSALAGAVFVWRRRSRLGPGGAGRT
jgi:hypothetical protein